MASGEPLEPPQTPGAVRIVRVFLALELPEAVRAAMGAAQRALRRHGDLPATWVAPHDAHLTLLFLGNIVAVHLPEIVGAITPVAARHAPFALRLGGIGAFPSVESPRVLWLDVAGQRGALAALQADTMAAMLHVTGVVADRKPFRPHLTLARIDARRDQPGMSAVAAALARPLVVPPLGWNVTRVVLMRTVPGASGGRRRYTTLHAFPLGGVSEVRTCD